MQRGLRVITLHGAIKKSPSQSISLTSSTISIFDSDLVWQIQLKIIKG